MGLDGTEPLKCDIVVYGEKYDGSNNAVELMEGTGSLFIGQNKCFINGFVCRYNEASPQRIHD